MYQLEWGFNPKTTKSDNDVHFQSKVDLNSIDSVYVLHWGEHCIECALPQCYKTCSLYVPRKDQRCARFRYGIFTNPNYSGLYKSGADISFRRWARMETDLYYGTMTIKAARRLAGFDKACISVVNPTASLLSPVNPTRRLNNIYYYLRRYLIQYISRDPLASPVLDEFIMEAWNPGSEPFTLMIEALQDQEVFRAPLLMVPGHNLHRIPCSSMGIDFGKGSGKIYVYPENDAEVRVIFTWLDFVSYRNPVAVTTGSSKPEPGAKVKCVAWDLDNTLWQGILIEDGPDAIQPRSESLELIKQLDERGILQTIVSKNDFDQAWAEIQKLGLEEYFLYPAINWGPKSKNIEQIAQELNINVDTFALIDDSPFERGEVVHELPQVRTYSDEEIARLLQKPEFDVSVSEESRNRRHTYMAEAQRKRIMHSFGDNYERFLRSCELKIDVFVPTLDHHIKRCLELIQRSNQLNLSTYRYENGEFLELLDNKNILSLAISCKDRFGDYGTVAFMSIMVSGEVPVIKDFVISCRIAQKRVEHSWLRWLLNHFSEAGYEALRARYIPSERNEVLLKTLMEVGFDVIEESPEGKTLELKRDQKIPGADLVAIIDQGVRFPWHSWEQGSSRGDFGTQFYLAPGGGNSLNNQIKR